MLTRDDLTARERIARPSGRARADRVVADGATLGVEAARADARILALAVHARERRGALAVCHALGPTFGRNTQVAGQARTNRGAAHLAAFAVRSARCRNTGPLRNHRFDRSSYRFRETCKS